MTTGPRPQTARGFTLVELMITVAIFAIVVSVAVPSFSEIGARQRVRSLAIDLHTALLLARSEALKRNNEVVVEPLAGGWSSGWRIRDMRDPLSPELIEIRQDVPSSTTIAGPASLTYRSSGRLAAAASLQVSSSTVAAVRRCVRTDLGGRPFVVDGACP